MLRHQGVIAFREVTDASSQGDAVAVCDPRAQAQEYTI